MVSSDLELDSLLPNGDKEQQQPPAWSRRTQRSALLAVGLAVAGVAAVSTRKSGAAVAMMSESGGGEFAALFDTSSCSAAGEGCLGTHCCQDSSLQCFKKNDEWADCKASCKAGEADPNSPAHTQGPWSCEVLACSVAGEGCLSTGCCNDKSFTCYEKNNEWADCKASCVAGEVDPNSPVDSRGPWTCQELNTTGNPTSTPGPPESQCSRAGEGCIHTHCCEDTSLSCWKKNDEWADCKGSCEAGKVDPNSPEGSQSPWECEKFECSEAGAGCLYTGCCSDPSLTCFQKDDEWADCKPACVAGEADPNSPEHTRGPWTCHVLTPDLAANLTDNS